MSKCEWIKDGWPHRQCQHDGIEIVDLPTGTFPTIRFCKRHARIVRQRLARGEWGY